MKNRSLRFRLCFYFIVFLTVTWLVAAVFSWLECKKYIDEFFDTQQMQYAKTLAFTDLNTLQNLHTRLPGAKELLPGLDKEQRGKEDDKALSFAVFNRDGQLVLANSKRGAAFVYQPAALGFSEPYDQEWEDIWRMYWLPSHDNNHIIVVGQRIKHRWEMAWDMLKKQLVPWLLLLPVLILMIIILTYRELASVKALARKLSLRSPNDVQPVVAERLPSEIRPLLQSLNGLFERTGLMINRERAFISDAAHELRTPLAAITVQAEVAMLSKNEPGELVEALDNILSGAGRISRLLEQLLNFSRLENMDKQNETQPLDVSQLLQQALQEHAHDLHDKEVEIVTGDKPVIINGNALFIELMLRNLLDNAIRYSDKNGQISITLNNDSLRIANSTQVDEIHLARLGEKFFRPPGQEQTGSGLGLSIVRRIAELHGFKFQLKNLRNAKSGEVQSRFMATVYFR